MMVNLSISTDITMGSSCEGLIPLKSSLMKVMGGILGRIDTVFTKCIALRCFFQALLELLSSVNLPTILLMTSWSPLFSFSLGGLLFLKYHPFLTGARVDDHLYVALVECSLFTSPVPPLVGTASSHDSFAQTDRDARLG